MAVVTQGAVLIQSTSGEKQAHQTLAEAVYSLCQVLSSKTSAHCLRRANFLWNVSPEQNVVA
jgi:hypothetical protein